ncbi:Bug family tripartite tricarboxylate transporter substrate binding protein [Roseomonas haemaphysalidis]|uniref:Tripartite tricarboxylate transporter substrate binding protein n=1 Tax=Roseomonas haemaphysalidis TaxID=2768162 RepID=A0ABS3KWI2_9PROT|nr:tripartite tricarboxylate transporter substrate-binding protein [Roseomonas haemaphysalidis]MBO1080691.1 tripartite tricarboxylate transporter substrate binding protein [Roseomonas haemaphysalidis]
MHRRALLRASLAAGVLSPLAAPALRAQGSADARFDHSLRIVVPNAPGGTSDILARLLAPELTKALGQSVVVENRTGAAGNIGADVVAKSAPDGHTLLLMDVSTLAINPSLFPRMPFDVQKDLAPVSMIIYAPYLAAVKNALPPKNAAELAAYLKGRAGGLNMANAGVGSLTHLTSVEIGAALGGDVTHVPYRGGAPAVLAVASGEADMIINGATATQPYVVNGQMRGIAVSGPKRLAALPNVPTFREVGWPMADAGTWQGVMVQGNTPPALIRRLEVALREAVAQPAMTARLAELGGEPRTDGPEAFRTWLAASTTEFGGVVTKHGIKPE